MLTDNCYVVVKRGINFLRCHHIIGCSFTVLLRSLVLNTMSMSRAKPSLSTARAAHECTYHWQAFTHTGRQQTLLSMQLSETWHGMDDCTVGAVSVVTVAGICNSVGGGVFLTCHRGAGGSGEYRSVSRLWLLIGNRWRSRL